MALAKIPDIQALEECSDYKKAVELGLRTFILDVVNNWSFNYEPIQHFNNIFYQRFDIVELDGFLKDKVGINRIDSLKDLFNIFKNSNIKVSEEIFERIYSLYELNLNVYCDIIEVAYELAETKEYSEYEGKTLDKYHDGIIDDDDDDDDDYIGPDPFDEF